MLESYAEIRRAAMDLLARRVFSRRELVRKLLRRVDDPSLLDQVLTVLVDENLLCDERFAEAFIRSCVQRGVGPLRISAELRQRGIAESIIQSRINSNDEQWFELISQVMIKKFGDKPLENAADKARRIRFLQYRGFNFDHIGTVLESA